MSVVVQVDKVQVWVDGKPVDDVKVKAGDPISDHVPVPFRVEVVQEGAWKQVPLDLD